MILFRFTAGAALLACAAVHLLAQPAWPPDAQHRHVIPHGFVTLTGEATSGITSEYTYTAEEYRRMASLGANVQVVRIFFGKIGAWPGHELDPKYLQRMDRMVALAKANGIQTIFKLTVYDLAGAGGGAFGSEEWTAFWSDRKGHQDKATQAWGRIFEHYKNEPAVIGYDLLNECNKGKLPLAMPAFVANYLVPFYERTIDVLQKTGGNKWVLYQPPITAAPMGTAPKRSRIVYAPHLYSDIREYVISGGTPNPSKYGPMLDRFEKEAAAAGAVLCIAEFGNPPLKINDDDPEKQALHARGERAVAEEFDRRAIGSIRPWFCGTRRYFGAPPTELTWALFKGESAASGPERKYIMDVLARPMPLVIAGKIETFRFDFGSREFMMRFVPDPAKGASEIYVPRQRHFPDGFRVVHSGGLTLAYDSSQPSGFRVLSNTGNFDAAAFRWDAARERILVSRWAPAASAVTLRIIPGIAD
ncbi:MAG: cellulase family glycosylhydrolase [Acidobacteria bacterium]|nr:cellulase family glycosylhydrolase [Acidobacteriota bacterium]